YWPTDGYDFNESLAIRNGKFCGLALDEDNESDKTETRIQTWATQVKQEKRLYGALLFLNPGHI
ncbi:MAG: hypothetical protein AAFV72_26600, partial [Cyanobacteria bacterium J06635_1]